MISARSVIACAMLFGVLLSFDDSRPVAASFKTPQALFEAPSLFRKAYQEQWCFMGTDGVEDCSYFTFAECHVAAEGEGNFCYQNPRYVPHQSPFQPDGMDPLVTPPANLETGPGIWNQSKD